MKKFFVSILIATLGASAVEATVTYKNNTGRYISINTRPNRVPGGILAPAASMSFNILPDEAKVRVYDKVTGKEGADAFVLPLDDGAWEITFTGGSFQVKKVS